MLLEILGYITYIILVFLAITWALGIRLKLGVGLHTIIGSLFFSLVVIIIPIANIPFIHSLWIIPLGYIVPLIVAYVLPNYQFLSKIFVLFGSIYAGIIRTGIDNDKIHRAQINADAEAVENWAHNKTENK